MFHTPPHKLDPSLPQAGQTTSRPYEGDPRVLVGRVCGSHGYVTSREGSRCPHCGPDAEVSAHGSVFIVQPLSPTGARWLDENIAHAPRWAGGYAVEARFVRDIVDGMVDAGLEVA